MRTVVVGTYVLLVQISLRTQAPNVTDFHFFVYVVFHVTKVEKLMKLTNIICYTCAKRTTLQHILMYYWKENVLSDL